MTRTLRVTFFLSCPSRIACNYLSPLTYGWTDSFSMQMQMRGQELLWRRKKKTCECVRIRCNDGEMLILSTFPLKDFGFSFSLLPSVHFAPK